MLANEHRVEHRSQARLKQLEMENAALQEKVAEHQARVEHYRQVAKDSTDAQTKIENELEFYRKYVFVKTGCLDLSGEAWSRCIENKEIPTIEYMREKHPTQAALVEARIAAARAMAVQIEDEKDDDVESEAMKRMVGMQVMNDALEDLDRRTNEFMDIFESALEGMKARKTQQNNDGSTRASVDGAAAVEEGQS